MANRLSATDARRVSPAFFIIRTLSISVNVFPAFALFFACSGSENFLPAPNQHRTFSYLRQEPGNTGSSLLLAALPHIHSKTACRGFKSFCPCHKPGGNTVFLPGFFLHVVHGNGVRFGSNSGFSHPVLPVLNRFHPLQHPKRTRFRLFRPKPGAFRSFCPLLTYKISSSVFVHPAV